MEQQELYELIGQYLAGELPDERRQEVERRMAEDDIFRKEVALHRQLKENFSDPARWRLRTMLDQAFREPLPPPKPPPAEEARVPSYRKTGVRRWVWVALLVGAALLAFLMWQRLKVQPPPGSPGTPTLPKPTPDSSLQINRPVAPPAPSQDTVPPASKPREKVSKTIPIAGSFTPNEILERRLKGKRRGDKIKFTFSAPKNGDTFALDQNGDAVVLFLGAASGFQSGSETVLNLRIFNNQDSQKPQSEMPLKLSADASGNAVLDAKLVRRLPQGLYYFQLEKEVDGVVLFTGKFIIRN